jgi:hypothetical protein
MRSLGRGPSLNPPSLKCGEGGPSRKLPPSLKRGGGGPSLNPPSPKCGGGYSSWRLGGGDRPPLKGGGCMGAALKAPGGPASHSLPPPRM